MHFQLQILLIVEPSRMLWWSWLDMICDPNPSFSAKTEDMVKKICYNSGDMGLFLGIVFLIGAPCASALHYETLALLLLLLLLRCRFSLQISWRLCLRDACKERVCAIGPSYRLLVDRYSAVTVCTVVAVSPRQARRITTCPGTTCHCCLGFDPAKHSIHVTSSSSSFSFLLLWKSLFTTNGRVEK